MQEQELAVLQGYKSLYDTNELIVSIHYDHLYFYKSLSQAFL